MEGQVRHPRRFQFVSEAVSIFRTSTSILKRPPDHLRAYVSQNCADHGTQLTSQKFRRYATISPSSPKPCHKDSMNMDDASRELA